MSWSKVPSSAKLILKAYYCILVLIWSIKDLSCIRTNSVQSNSKSRYLDSIESKNVDSHGLSFGESSTFLILQETRIHHLTTCIVRILESLVGIYEKATYAVILQLLTLPYEIQVMQREEALCDSCHHPMCQFCLIILQYHKVRIEKQY